MLSNGFQEDLLSAGTVIQSEMGGRVAGEGQDDGGLPPHALGEAAEGAARIQAEVFA